MKPLHYRRMFLEDLLSASSKTTTILEENPMEWLVVVPPIITCIGVLVAVWQLRMNHERDRRQYASKLIWDWALNSRQNTTITIQLVHEVDESICNSIFNQEAFEIHPRYSALLKGALSDKPPSALQSNNGNLVVDVESSSHLRNSVSRYLNQVEAIFVAWAHGIADPEIIEHEFNYLVTRGKQEVYMQKYLNVSSWVTNYPAIYQYSLHLEKIRREKLKQRRPPV